MFSKSNKKGELRYLKHVYRKGDKIVKEEQELQRWNGWYWATVPMAVVVRSWDEDNKYYRHDGILED